MCLKGILVKELLFYICSPLCFTLRSFFVEYLELFWRKMVFFSVILGVARYLWISHCFVVLNVYMMFKQFIIFIEIQFVPGSLLHSGIRVVYAKSFDFCILYKYVWFTGIWVNGALWVLQLFNWSWFFCSPDYAGCMVYNLLYVFANKFIGFWRHFGPYITKFTIQKVLKLQEKEK